MEQADVIKKIALKAKNLKFYAQREGSHGAKLLVVYAQEVCIHPDYPNFYFVAKNMHYVGGDLKDSSYTAYSFNDKGDLVEKLDYENDLPTTFMRDRKTFTTIE